MTVEFNKPGNFIKSVFHLFIQCCVETYFNCKIHCKTPQRIFKLNVFIIHSNIVVQVQSHRSIFFKKIYLWNQSILFVVKMKKSGDFGQMMHNGKKRKNKTEISCSNPNCFKSFNLWLTDWLTCYMAVQSYNFAEKAYK